jgi:hypothetical protein
MRQVVGKVPLQIEWNRGEEERVEPGIFFTGRRKCFGGEAAF